MGTSFYILLFANLIIYLVNFVFGGFIDQNEITISLLLIAIIGIPHGAVDHILFLKKTNKSKLFFYSFYLFLILVYIVMWIYFPLISLTFFLLLSAYHFGQSQLQQYPKLKKHTARLMSILWGLSVLSSFVLLNFDQIFSLMNEQSDLVVFTKLFNYSVFNIVFCSSFIGFTFLSLINYKRFAIGKELIYFLLITATFYFQSVFIGFSLFFVFNHSLEVLQSEHTFLSRIRKNFNFIQFIRDLMPFTLLSLFGITFFYLLSEMELFNLSLPLLILISISSLTLPHAVVMEVFYKEEV
jgi:Brp/Blh family beta-carotene 15,15'-monooxygenase